MPSKPAATDAASGVDEAVDHPGQVVVGGHLDRVRRGRSGERGHQRRPTPPAVTIAGQLVGRRRPLLRRHEQRPTRRRCRAGSGCRRARAGRRWPRRGGGRRRPGAAAPGGGRRRRAPSLPGVVASDRVGDADRPTTISRPAPPRARASNQAAWASPTVPSASPRLVPIGHRAIRLRSSQRPELPGGQQPLEPVTGALTTAGRCRCRCRGWSGRNGALQSISPSAVGLRARRRLARCSAASVGAGARRVNESLEDAAVAGRRGPAG